LREGNAIPVCFARIKAADIKAENFTAKARWILLQEDKGIDALNDGDFPGQVLIKLGFGAKEQADATLAHWEDAERRMNTSQSFLVRFHLYQCRDLMPADSNGYMNILDSPIYISHKLFISLFYIYLQVFRIRISS
jgi:hypothetical protein